jgi:hypothetical protein
MFRDWKRSSLQLPFDPGNLLSRALVKFKGVWAVCPGRIEMGPELSEHVSKRDLRLGRLRDKASRHVKQQTLGHGEPNDEIIQHFVDVGHSTPPQIAPETASLYRAYVDWSDRCSTRLMQPEAEAIS